MTRLLAPVGAAGAAVLVAAGCSSTAGAGSAANVNSKAAGPSTAATSSAATAPATSPASTAPAAAGDVNQPPAGSRTLHFGQSSLVGVTDFTTEKTHTLRLTVSLRQGSLADLKDFELDAQTKKSTPFYVSIKVTNVGTAAVDTSGFGGLLTVADAAGDTVSSLTLLDTFSKCEGAVPDKLQPGQTGNECDVYTAPQGERVTKVSIDNGSTDASIAWS